MNLGFSGVILVLTFPDFAIEANQLTPAISIGRCNDFCVSFDTERRPMALLESVRFGVRFSYKIAGGKGHDNESG